LEPTDERLMARIRSVSPDLRVSETCAAWSREARYAWVLLWGYLDDYGRGLDNAKVIAADLFPLDDDVDAELVEDWLRCFEEDGSICRYAQDGKRYLHCVNWSDYQKPQHPGKVRVPPCPQHETAAHAIWEEAHGRSSRNPHEPLVNASPTRGRGRSSKEMSEEVSKEERGGRSSGRPAPPRFPDHCPKHADVAQPGKCGECKDARIARAAGMTHLSLVPAKVMHCGNCDENRQIETPVGVIRCPECHPLAEEAS
jgi:hypothetical protein